MYVLMAWKYRMGWIQRLAALEPESLASSNFVLPLRGNEGLLQWDVNI